jgi:uncharacterized membrane protein YeiB
MASSVSPDAPRAAPITSLERILYIDVLRGRAWFGILAANMRGFNAPESVHGNIEVLFHGRADLITAVEMIVEINISTGCRPPACLHGGRAPH